MIVLSRSLWDPEALGRESTEEIENFVSYLARGGTVEVHHAQGEWKRCV